ncbi:MAG TPA: TIGR02281 family clan AA aspartic protease [Burkholderiales bacterium]
MATGFILRNFIGLWLLLACGAASADVALIGVIGRKAAVLAVDGGDPKTVKVGQTWNGITVHEVTRDSATVEVEGRRRVLPLGAHYRGAPPPMSREAVVLPADGRGHFFAEGSVNGVPMRFLVDTGASMVVLPAQDARRLGIDYAAAPRTRVQTAGGAIGAYLVTLDRVKVGAIELHSIDGIVVEHGGAVPLLGMSFLNRVEMRRSGDSMTLIRRF